MHDAIEKVSAGAVFGLNDPKVGVEADLSGQIGLRFGVRCRHCFHGRGERAIDRMLVLERGLRGRSIDVRGIIKAVDLNENRPCIIGATPANRGKHSLDVTAPHVG